LKVSMESERNGSNLSTVSNSIENDDTTGLPDIVMQKPRPANEDALRLEDEPQSEEQQTNSTEELTSRSDVSENQREGTITSARFNILTSMVGGGSLSLPLAFYQAGNGFLAPFLLICIAALVEYSVYFLVRAGNHAQRTNGASSNSKGSLAYESVASSALGKKAGHLSMALVCTICFGAIAGYGVLLRDMLLPISDYLSPNGGNNNPTFVQNITMLIVVLLVTPLCTLQNLTALQSIGMASIISILILFSCVAYRSVECNFSSEYDNIRHMPWREYISYLPSHDDKQSSSSTATLHQLANSLPILITVFMCHFNVLPVHNELVNPSPKRVNQLFSTSIWSATIFYLLMGFVGSMYGNCAESGRVEGNVLLSFPDDDVLLILGRGCLTLAIAFALPVFVVPTRDMFLRGLDSFCTSHPEEVDDGDHIVDNLVHSSSTSNNMYANPLEDSVGGKHDLIEPLLATEGNGGEICEVQMHESHSSDGGNDNNRRRVIASITILWAAAALACCVESIDTVWGVLGGSFQIIVGFIIPSASYLSLTRPNQASAESETNAESDADEYSTSNASNTRDTWYRTMAWILLIIFVPVMFICTCNSVYNIVNDN